MRGTGTLQDVKYISGAVTDDRPHMDSILSSTQHVAFVTCLSKKVLNNR